MTCRPLLTHGSAVFRRDRTHLQIGTNPGWVVNDQPGLFALLRKLNGVRDMAHLQQDFGNKIDVRAVVGELIGAGIAVDAASWVGGPSQEHQSAVAQGLDPAAVPMRRSYRVAIASDDASAPVGAAISRLLRQSGITLVIDGEYELMLSCTLGEPNRSVFTAASQYGADQLPVIVDGHAIRCGPYIRPARWPCLICHDLDRTDWDRGWPGLLHQHGSSPPAGLAVSAALIQLVSAHIVDDVVSTAENRTPELFAAVRLFGPALRSHTRRAVAFHPDCTCTRLIATAS